MASVTSELVQRKLAQFQRDNARVMARYFGPEGTGGRDTLRVIRQFLDLPARLRQTYWDQTHQRFSARHRHFRRILRRHFARLVQWLENTPEHDLLDVVRELPEHEQLLLAAYMTYEYSVESAAFFNPSIIPHPSQEGLPPGAVRFIISFRATGEGHVSSVAFRSGVIAADHEIHLDEVTPFISHAVVETHRKYDRMLFARKLQELKIWNAFTGAAIALLPKEFTRSEMEKAIASLGEPFEQAERESGAHAMRFLAESNYRVQFDEEDSLSERVIFPVSPTEKHGIEDARFVRFTNPDGSPCYYATYTAFSGDSSAIQMIETFDFQTFEMCTLNGPAVKDKGMALFPRQINGDYWMLGRQDGRSITVSRSRHLHFWYEYQPVLQPRETWELIKMGNCGSPIETPRGWLVLTHGVGPVRRYCIGAALLDLNNPTRVIGRMKQPLIEPLESEREGYVPNVVYTCGGMVHNDRLIIPYAMSDTRSGIASANLADLLDHIITDGP